MFAGEGGAGAGYARAGFEVTAVDIDADALAHNPAPATVCADALDVLTDAAFLDRFDVVHASPPCPAYSSLRTLADTGHPRLIAPVRAALVAWADRTGGTYVIENVPGAPLRAPLVLCGTEFGLSTSSERGRVWLRRHRLFESNAWLMGAGGCHCANRRIIGVYGTGDGGTGRGWKGTLDQRRAAMGIDWMTRHGLAQAIPPAYTHHIGAQLHDHTTSTSTSTEGAAA